MTNHASSIFEYDRDISWTEHCRRRAYAIVAATDQAVLAHETSGIVTPPLGSTRAGALIKWARDEAAETIKYFETEHEEVVAAKADKALIDLDLAVRLGVEMARKRDDEQLGPNDVGPEAVAYATDRLKSKIKRDAVYNPIAEVYSGLLSYGFLKTRSGGGKVIYHHNRPQSPKPPAPTDDWLVDYVRRNGPLTIHQWRDLFRRRSTQYALYRLERLWHADRLSRSWMPRIEGAVDSALIYAPRPSAKGGRL